MRASRPQSWRGWRAGPHLGLGCLLLGAGCAGDAGVASVLVVATVQVDPPSGAVVLGQTLQLTATPKTEGGIPLPAHNVIWSSTDNATATVSPNGMVTGQSIGGPVRIRATVERVTGETQITVLPIPVDHVIVTPATSNILVGQQAPLTATAYDAANTVLTGRTFTWASDASSIAAITTTGLVLGMAPGGPVTISASAEGKSGSATVTVSRRPASRVGFGQQPGQTRAGIPLTPAVQVLIQDDLLGTVTDATNPVTLALAGSPGGATLTGTTTVAAVNGVATFADLVLDRAATGYTLLATAPGLTPAISAPFTVVAGAANRLALTTTPPATARSGVTFGTPPVVQIQDGFGNPVSQSGVIVTASIASGNGTLGGTLAVTTDASGTAAFSNISLAGPVGAFTLSFGAPGITPVTTGTITLTAGVPAALSIVTQPSATAQSGVALARQPAVRLLDGSGNFVLQSGVFVTAAIASGPVGGTLGGSAIGSTDNNGVAAFAGLGLTGPAGSYVLGFGSGVLPTVTSTPVVLAAGGGAGLSLTTQPSASTVSGQAFAQQPVIQLLDAAGNPVSQAGVIVSASIQSGAGTLGGGTTATSNSAGVAAFTDLSISGPAGDRTLLFAAAGYAPVVSGTVTVGSGIAAKLAVTGQPTATAQSGVAFPQQPVIQIQDGSGNPVSQPGVTITASLASGPAGGSLGGILVATTGANGAAAYSNLSVTGPAGAYTLAFAAAALSGTTANPVTLGPPGPASQLTITTQPSATAANGVPFPQQPVVQVVDASGNPVSGVVVTVAIASGGGTLGGTSTATSDANGNAGFTDLSISGTIGARTLGFTASGTPGATSNTISLTAGPATQLVIVREPSGTARRGSPFSQQPIVQVLDAAGNGVSGVPVTAAINSTLFGNGRLSGGLTRTTDAAGSATFTDLEISRSGLYVLRFSSGGLTVVSSVTIIIT